jgi:hypothetical protein
MLSKRATNGMRSFRPNLWSENKRVGKREKHNNKIFNVHVHVHYAQLSVDYITTSIRTVLESSPDGQSA